MDKAEWVKDWLEPTMVAANCGVRYITYHKHERPYVDDNGQYHSDEELIVEYESGRTKSINVACDSKAAMVEDLYKQGGVY